MTRDAQGSLIGGLSPAQYRRALGRIPASIVVAGTLVQGMPVGLVVGTFAAVSLTPPLVGFFGDRRARALDELLQGAAWSFTLLGDGDVATLEAFREPDGRRYDAASWSVSDHNTPHLAGAALTIDAVPHEVATVDDHAAVLGRVVAVRVGDPLVRPLVLQAGRLARLEPGQLVDRELSQLGWKQ
jgi:flavin reductase (DIM6/NTAB) family NADH-FMN oxidoreductase RutF